MRMEIWSKKAKCYKAEHTENGTVLYYQCLDTGKKTEVKHHHKLALDSYLGVVAPLCDMTGIKETSMEEKDIHKVQFIMAQIKWISGVVVLKCNEIIDSSAQTGKQPQDITNKINQIQKLIHTVNQLTLEVSKSEKAKVAQADSLEVRKI